MTRFMPFPYGVLGLLERAFGKYALLSSVAYSAVPLFMIFGVKPIVDFLMGLSILQTSLS